MKPSFFQDYFHYTRTERNATLILFILIVFTYTLPQLYPYILPKKTSYDFSEYQKEIDAFMAAIRADSAALSEDASSRNIDVAAQNIEEFYFDPNRATREDFIRLGLSPRVASTIVNYRNKGGKFYKPDDFSRIYALRQEDFERLRPFIQIEGINKSESTLPPTSNNRNSPTPDTATSFKNEISKHPFKKGSDVIIDINAASTEEWQQLKGIGPGYAKRIVNYREKLGGFSSVKQVAETYGLPDSTFQQIMSFLKTSPVKRKIRVNSATLEELKSHPYISNFQAIALFNYRQQHGAFTDMGSLRKMLAFKESDWIRLEPYISFD